MERKIGTAPTLVYPESDGEPMAETGRHVRITKLIRLSLVSVLWVIPIER